MQTEKPLSQLQFGVSHYNQPDNKTGYLSDDIENHTSKVIGIEDKSVK